MGQRVHRGREGWADLVRRQEVSGESARAFCDGESINLNSFYRWRGRIREEVGSDGSKTEVPRNEFFEVGRIHTQDDVTPKSSPHPMEVKLDFGDGFTVTVHRG